jgi:hypothetical protein
MLRTTVWLSMVVFALVTSAGPAFAIKPPTTKPPKPPAAKAQAPKSSPKASKPAKASSAPKASTTSGSKSAKVTAPKGSSKKSSTPASTGSMTTTTSPTTSPTTPVWTNDVAKKLSTKPTHLAKLESALGLGTLTPEQINGATSGFKNFGQLNAAVNTSLNNPNVEFADLKALMTGLDMKGEPITGQTTTYSLGQAKQRLGIADGTESSTTMTTTSTKTKKRTNTTSGGTQ